MGEAGRISVNDVIVYATAKTLQKHPKFNALWVEDHVQTHSQINIGIAVALDDGLVVPAILDVGHKGLQQISHETRDVADRAKSGSLRAEEYTNATFNISNLGAFGVDVLTAIITPALKIESSVSRCDAEARGQGRRNCRPKHHEAPSLSRTIEPATAPTVRASSRRCVRSWRRRRR